MSDCPERTLKAGVVDVNFGSRVTVVEPVNLYDCSLSDDCFIGPFVEIQTGVRIGPRTRIQSHTFICELVTIGADCFVGHGVVFVNDAFARGGPARGDRSQWQATVIGDRVSIGSGVTLLPVQVCDGAVLGAGAVVTRDISDPGIYAGNPARMLRRLDDPVP